MAQVIALQAAPITERAVRDTVAAVFRQPAFDRSLRETVLDRLLEWLADGFRALFGGMQRSAGAQWVGLALLVLLVVAIAARAAFLVYSARIDRAEASGGRQAGGVRVRGGDTWAEAEALAQAGRFTEAAHLLYAAILDAIARRERVRLHPSRTVGDYGRELRRRSSALAPRYRDFARLYEVVIYGLGTCDRSRFERLHALARDIVHA